MILKMLNSKRTWTKKKMIDVRFLICTECQKNNRRKPKQFKSVKNLNIHLTRKHGSRYKVRVEKSTIAISRVKRPKLKSNLC